MFLIDIPALFNKLMSWSNLFIKFYMKTNQTDFKSIEIISLEWNIIRLLGK